MILDLAFAILIVFLILIILVYLINQKSTSKTEIKISSAADLQNTAYAERINVTRIQDKIFSDIVERGLMAEELRRKGDHKAAKDILLYNILFPDAPPGNYKTLAKIYRSEGDLQEELNILMRFKSFNIGKEQVKTSYKYIVDKRIPVLIKRIEGDLNMNDNDIIYLWKAKDKLFQNKPIYKIGITSKRLGSERIRSVSLSSGFQFDILLFRNTKRAKYLETQMLKFGLIPDLNKFDGSTEFRALNDHELKKVLKIGFEINDAE